MRTFVDTNVVVYAYDQREPEKSAIAREILSDLWRTREGVLSTQVLQELYVNLTRKLCDALIVVAAIRGGAERIVSGDLERGRTIGGVRIENPFRT